WRVRSLWEGSGGVRLWILQVSVITGGLADLPRERPGDAEERSYQHPRLQARNHPEAGRGDHRDDLRGDEGRSLPRRKHRDPRAWGLSRQALRGLPGP